MCRGTGVLLEFPAREGICRLEYYAAAST